MEVVKANPVGKIHFRGKDYPIKITMGVLNRFEEATGFNALNSGWRGENLTSRLATTFIWACLTRNHKELDETITVDDVADEYGIGEWAETMTGIWKLIADSMPKPPEASSTGAETKNEAPQTEEPQKAA